LSCVLNIEAPLPYVWKIGINTYENRKDKILRTLKLLKELHNAYETKHPPPDYHIINQTFKTEVECKRRINV
jgi:hypothetical protein